MSLRLHFTILAGCQCFMIITGYDIWSKAKCEFLNKHPTETVANDKAETQVHQIRFYGLNCYRISLVSTSQ